MSRATGSCTMRHAGASVTKNSLLFTSIVLGTLPGGLLFGLIVYSLATAGEQIFKSAMLTLVAIVTGLVGFVIAVTPVGIGLFAPDYEPAGGAEDDGDSEGDEQIVETDADDDSEIDDEEMLVADDDGFDDDGEFVDGEYDEFEDEDDEFA